MFSKVCPPLLDQLDLPAICNWAEVDGEEDDVRQQRRDDLVPDLQEKRNEKEGCRLDIFVFLSVKCGPGLGLSQGVTDCH